MLIRLDASDTQLYIYFSFFMTLTMLWQLWLDDNCDTSDFVLKDGQNHRKVVNFFLTTWGDFTKTFISVRYVYCILWKRNIHMLFVWINCVLQSRRNGSWRFWLRRWRCFFSWKIVITVILKVDEFYKIVVENCVESYDYSTHAESKCLKNSFLFSFLVLIQFNLLVLLCF